MGFRGSCGSNFSISHWLCWSSLQHSHTTVWACDKYGTTEYDNDQYIKFHIWLWLVKKVIITGASRIHKFVKRNDFSSACIDMLRYRETYHCFVSQAKFQSEKLHVNPSYKTWCKSNWRYVAQKNTMHWRPCNLALKIVHRFTDACQSYLIDVENRNVGYNFNIGLMWYFAHAVKKHDALMLVKY